MKKTRLFSILVICLLLLGFSIADAAKREADNRPVKKDAVQVDNNTNNTSNSESSQQIANPVRETNNSNIISNPDLPYIPSNPNKSPETGEQINWQVISGGGGTGTSTNYTLSFTIGQTAVGTGTSSTYNLNHGFWQQFMFGTPTCCVGVVGDANMSHETTGEVSVGDIGAIVNMLFGSGEVPIGQEWCIEEADANLTAAIAGHPITIADISVGDIGDIVNHLFVTGDPLPVCP